MRLAPVTRRLAAWIALCAMLMATLAPAVSQALGSGPSWIEVCTAQGSRWVASADDDASSTPKPSGEHLLEHCPYCSLHTPALGLPPSPMRMLPADPLGRAVPQAFLSAPRTLHAWVRAQPRAPPLAA